MQMCRGCCVPITSKRRGLYSAGQRSTGQLAMYSNIASYHHSSIIDQITSKKLPQRDRIDRYDMTTLALLCRTRRNYLSGLALKLSSFDDIKNDSVLNQKLFICLGQHYIDLRYRGNQHMLLISRQIYCYMTTILGNRFLFEY